MEPRTAPRYVLHRGLRAYMLRDVDICLYMACYVVLPSCAVLTAANSRQAAAEGAAPHMGVLR